MRISYRMKGQSAGGTEVTLDGPDEEIKWITIKRGDEEFDIRENRGVRGMNGITITTAGRMLVQPRDTNQVTVADMD